MSVKNNNDIQTEGGDLGMRNNKKMEQLAKDIYIFLSERGMWGDTRIYFNGKAFCTESDSSGSTQVGKDLYVIEDIDPATFMEYYNSDTITMSFEGVYSMYEALNYGTDGWRTLEDFLDLIEKHGYYFEQGNYWNLHLVQL